MNRRARVGGVALVGGPVTSSVVSAFSKLVPISILTPRLSTHFRDDEDDSIARSGELDALSCCIHLFERDADIDSEVRVELALSETVTRCFEEFQHFILGYSPADAFHVANGGRSPVSASISSERSASTSNVR